MTDKVKFHATESLVCIHWLEDLNEAADLMHSRNIRHVAVVDDSETIVGILSDRDLLRVMRIDQAEYDSTFPAHAALPSVAHVRDFMTSPVQTIDEDASTADAARMMIDKKISSLLVTQGRYAVGIVTTEDLLWVAVHKSEGMMTTIKDVLNAVVVDSRVALVANALANVGI